MIRIEGLVKHYGEVKAVRGINFEVRDGEILGFLGANGAGKSTTLKIMTSFLTPTAGNVFVNDLNILDHSLEIRRQIGYLPELNPLYTDMRVYDLLEFVAKIRDITGKSFKQSMARVVEQCGLEGVVHKQVSDLSKGYKQRVGLATAIIHDPKILILDEPVTGLDPNQIVEIRELIKELGREKMVVISSHILQEIEVTVDRIVIIHNGSLVADGTRDELMAGFLGKTQLTLEIKNASEDSIGKLGSELENVAVVRTEPVHGNYVVVMEYDKHDDPREKIFNLAKSENWVLLEISPKKTQLEDIFRTLTRKEAAHA